MLVKASLLACALVSAPFCFTSPESPTPTPTPAPQDGGSRAAQDSKPAPQQDGERAKNEEIERLRARIRALEAKADAATAAHDAARRTAGAAEAQADALKRQLDECMTLLEQSTARVRGNCTPARTRKLLTYYQWMQHNGHQQRANRMLTQVLQDTHRNTESLNSLAWHLLTNKETSGKFDAAALAIAECMEKNGHLRHHHADTIALAKFLNGHVDDAIAMQKKAIAAGGNSDEYRRRLRVYEVARGRAEVAARVVRADTGAGGQ